MSEGTSGNGETMKQLIRQVLEAQSRIEGKIEAHIQEEAAHRQVLLASIGETKTQLQIHTADDHPRKVGDLRDAELREEGRKDVLRYIFGASLMGFLTAMASLLVTLWSLLTNAGK